MRMVATPLSQSGEPLAELSGAFLIVGQNAVGRALQVEIKRRGAAAVELPMMDSIDDAKAALDRIWQHTATPHLLLVTPFDDDAVTDLSASAWARRRQKGLMIPYFVCQRWLQLVTEAQLLEQASVVAVSNLGGDFGFSAPLRAAEGGALAGLVKALRIEVAVARSLLGKFRTKAIDAPPDMPPAMLAQRVLDELAGDALEVEVAYVDSQRYVIRPFAQPAEQLPVIAPPRGGTWVVSGGARGITAAIARELGRHLQLKVHLLGSGGRPQVDPAWRDLSPEGTRALRAQICKAASQRGQVPIDAWKSTARAIEIDRNLRAFEEAGVPTTYHSCDVSDRAALAAVLASIRQQDGPIQGIIHGAGVEQACAFHKKQPELVSRTIAAKVDGAAALMELTREDPLQFFLGFGSISGRFGGAGQTDYCLANEMLSKLIGWYCHRRPECRANTIMWHAWDEIGMAARPESKNAPALRGMKYLPPAEGIGHLAAELWRGLPERETMITDPDLCERVYPEIAGDSQQPLPDVMFPGQTRAEDPAAGPGTGPGREEVMVDPAVHAESVRTPARPARFPPPAPAPDLRLEAFPLLDAVAESAEGKSPEVHLHLDPVQDPFLREHRFRDKPMMPIVMASEAFAETAAFLAGGDQVVVGLRNMEVVNALRFFSNDTVRATVRAKPAGSLVMCELASPFQGRSKKITVSERIHMRAVVELGTRCEPAEAPELDRPPCWYDVWYPDAIAIYHGPPFRCLRMSALDENGAWGRIPAPRPEELMGGRSGLPSIIPAAVLDACFYECGILAWFQDEGAVAIPQSFRRLRLWRQPSYREDCIVRVKRTVKLSQSSEFDFTLYGEDGTGILQVEGYQAVVVPAPAKSGETA